MKNFIRRNCVELEANEGYVITNYKEGDERIEFRRIMHVPAESESDYYAMKESEARIKEIQLEETWRENMMRR